MTESATSQGQWSGSGRLRGGRRGLRIILASMRCLGLRLTYLLATPVALFCSLVSPDVPATMAYHRRVFGLLPRWRRRWMVVRHFYEFGLAIVDRLAVLGGLAHKFTFTFEGEHHLREALAEGRGLLLLTGHVGNWEAAGPMLARLDRPVNVTGFDRELPEVRALLDRMSKAKVRLVPLTGSAADTLPLVAALRRGEVVAMLGDRAYGSPSVPVSFLGGTALLPVGAYVMAAVAKAPLVHVFNVREPGAHYHCFGFPAQWPELPPRSRRNAYLAECAGRFAADMETVVRRAPLQWYNFFPFWASDPPPSVPESEPALCASR